MRPVTVISSLLIALGAGLLLWREVLREKEIAALLAARQQAAEDARQAAAQQPATEPAVTMPFATPPVADAVWQAGAMQKMAALERQVAALKSAVRTVPEYDPDQAGPAPVTDTATNDTPKRGWGPEQALGPPDTERATDSSTAWASLKPDGGPEWLAVGFDQPTAIAEVRIRESFNPGAITKVAAVINGQEYPIWEGQAARVEGMRDFVVRPTFDVAAQSILIYLDTARVPGWNEIDAVELVGRDGSRQWASSASASSSYTPQTYAKVPIAGGDADASTRQLQQFLSDAVQNQLEGGQR